MYIETGSIRKQSAVIPMRRNSRGGLEILLVTNKARTRWVIPKGNIERDMTPGDSAAKEAWEEAGAIGKTLDRVVGTYFYEKNDAPHRVDVYAMVGVELAPEWPEPERRRRWVEIIEAATLVHSHELSELLYNAADTLYGWTMVNGEETLPFVDEEAFLEVARAVCW